MQGTPELRYARRAAGSLAYITLGEGPEMLLVSGAASMTVPRLWEDPITSSTLRELARSARLVAFDQRGAGYSDPLPTGDPLTLEERMADVLAVVEEAGLQRPWLFAFHDGGPVALMLATSAPERFAGLLLINTAPRMAWAEDYPMGLRKEDEEAFLALQAAHWGTGGTMPLWAPSLAELPDGKERWARLEQAACSPSQAIAQTRQALSTDARDLLPLVSVPTLVVHARFDPSLPADVGRYVADRIRHSILVELPNGDHMPFIGDQRAMVDAVVSFVNRSAPFPDPTRRLATVVFTDIVDSTRRAAEIGDGAWSSVLDRHDALAAAAAARAEGQIIKGTGDGVLAAFDGPARGVGFAREVIRDVRELGIEVRAGVHTGEVQLRGDDLAGITLHVAARVAALAAAGEVWVSSTVVDLTAGSGIRFRDAGTHPLKGLDRSWQLFVVDDDRSRMVR